MSDYNLYYLLVFLKYIQLIKTHAIIKKINTIDNTVFVPLYTEELLCSGVEIILGKTGAVKKVDLFYFI